MQKLLSRSTNSALGEVLGFALFVSALVCTPSLAQMNRDEDPCLVVPADVATNFSPFDGQVAVQITTTLSWTTGYE